MEKLKFQPSPDWQEIQKSVMAAAKLISSCKNIDFNKVANDLFLDKVTMPTEQLEDWLSGATERQAKNFVDLYMRFWNQTPRKAFGGRSPDQESANYQPVGIDKPSKANEWTKLSDLLLTIQGNFQAELYEVLDNYPQGSWKPVIDNVHRLFERYYYTMIGDFLPDEAVSPADLVEGEIIGRNIRLPKNEQVLIRLFKSPERHKDAHKQIRMTVGQESLEHSPLMLDLKQGHKKSQFFPHDHSYNQYLDHVRKHVPDGKLLAVATEFWRCAMLTWRNHNVVLKKAFDETEWIALWGEIFYKAASEWQTTDEVFEILMQAVHERSMPMSAAAQMLHASSGRYVEPLNHAEFLQYVALYDMQSTFHSLFLSPLTTYLPLLEVRFVEPMDISQEVDDSMQSGVDFVNEISKPPSYFRLRQPVAAKLWKKLSA